MNLLKYYSRSIIWYFLTLLINGAVLQTFLLEYGVSERMVNDYCSSMQIVQFLSMLSFAKKMDQIKNVIKASAYCHLSSLVLLVPLLFISIHQNIPIGKTVILLFVLGSVCNIFLAISSTLDYKLPYSIMDMRDYGTVSALVGALANLISLLCTASISFFQRWHSYFGIMTVIFLLGTLCVPVSVVLTRTMKDNGYSAKKEDRAQTKTKRNIFRYRPFYALFVPNLLRGLCAGMFTLAVSVGYYQGVLSVKSASVLATVSFVTAFLGFFSYPLLSKKLSEHRLLLYFSIGMVVSLPLMLIGNKTNSYILFYGIVSFLINVINNAVPVAVTKIVDYDMMGQYSSWRLLCHAVGTALGGFLCIPMIDFFGGVITLLIYGVCQLISGASYYVYMRKYGIDKK